MTYKFKIGETVFVSSIGRGVIEDYQVSTIDNKHIPSYWIKFDNESYARNIYESNISHKIYTVSDALNLKKDIDVLMLPKRIYCKNKEAMNYIASKLCECHIGNFSNEKELFIQT